MKSLSEFTETSFRRLAALRQRGPSFADLVQIYNGQNILWMQSVEETRYIAPDSDFQYTKGAFESRHLIATRKTPDSSRKSFPLRSISGRTSTTK